MSSVRDALLSHGRAAFESVGGEWPERTVSAVAAYWSRHDLGWA